VTAFLASLLLLSPPAIAEPFAVTDAQVTRVVEMIGREDEEAVVLFVVALDGQAGGGVVSQDGTILCDESWRARIETEGELVRFHEIVLSAASCGSDALLQEFAERLGRVSAVRVTEEGQLLLDPAGKPLLRLITAG